MSTRQMLYALSRVNSMFAGVFPPSAETWSETQKIVAHALTAGMTTSNRMAQAAAARSTGGKVGRKPTTVYLIDINGAEPFTTYGGRATVDAVNKELAALGVKRLLSVNNLTTIISTKGEWWRNVETDSGTVTISVQKIGAKHAKYPKADWDQESA